jgi:hypothetical protein
MTITAGMGLLGSFSFSPGTITVSLQDAISKGLVKHAFIGAGGYSGKCVTLHLQNNTNSTYNISLPPGTLFYPKDPGQQTLITVEPQYVSLAPKAKEKTVISAFCSEHSDRSPNSSSTFTLGKNKNPKFDSLFHFIQNKKIPEVAHQDIVWAISDDSPVSYISQDTKELKDLRTYLYKVTGQKEEKYAMEMIRNVNEHGYITEQPYQVKGHITFKVNENKWIHQEVYDQTGKLKFKSDQAFEIPRGESDYKFNIRLKGWKTGEYILKLKAGSEEIEKYEFKV